MNSPLDLFFGLGDKVTKGDPYRKALFDYYLLWMIFMAFFIVLLSDLWAFYKTLNFTSLGWGLVVLGILWFQYFTLKYARQGVISMKNIKQGIKVSKVDEVSPEEMLKEFK